MTRRFSWGERPPEGVCAADQKGFAVLRARGTRNDSHVSVLSCNLRKRRLMRRVWFKEHEVG